jgi:hypothetical protein
MRNGFGNGPVRIEFVTAASARMFSEFDLMARVFGRQVAYKLANRLALLSAADNLALVPTSPPIECRPLDGGDGCFAVSISPKLQLVFNPLDGASSTAKLAKVVAIQIRGVEKL